MISKRAQQILPSPTFALVAKVKEMKKQGIDIISFGIGEPDFPTPTNIKNAAKKAIDENFTKYTPGSGIPELKEAIVEKFKKDNNLDYDSSQILISTGAKQCLYNIMQTILDKDDEAILFSPYWVSYIEQIKLADAKPVIVKTNKDFKIDFEEFNKNITDKTKLILINSPNNPTGAVFSEEELKKLADIAVEKNIYVISDEIYEKLIYSGKHVSIASFNDKIKELTITVNGVSKSYSMTGWRIGYCAGNKNIIKAAANIQDQSTSCPNSIAQKAALEALTADQKAVKEMRNEFMKRRNYILERLNKVKGVECNVPDGAFYVLPNVSKLYKGKLKDSTSFATALLEKANIAVVPGVAFGDDDYIRFSYATSIDKIKEGMNRFEKFCRGL